MKEISKEGGPPAARGYYGKGGKPLRRKSQKAYYARRRRIIGLALLAGLCVLLLVFLIGPFGGEGTIRPGVEVGSVDVGGMTRSEARAAIERNATAELEEIRFGDGVFAVPGKALGVKVDAAAAAQEAYGVGREDGFFGRVSGILGAYVGGPAIEPRVAYEEGAARVTMKNLAARYLQKPQNASFSVTDDGEVEVKQAREGRVLDQGATFANLDRSLQNVDGQVPIAEGAAPKPAVTTQEVENLRPTEVIGEYQTDFRWDSNPDRKENMKLAAGAVNNTTLAPGEIFSFNELASSLDYHEAKTFSDGGVDFANGGGLCQVSSTLYMAAQYAGLESIERHPHYAVLPYIKPGFDATVWFGDEYGYGALDMRFKNTTDGYVVIREWVDEQGYLNAEILGRPTGKKVEMRTTKIFEDTTRGIRWDTYKKVTGENGEVLRDGLLYKYTYSYNPPAPDTGPHYETSAPRVSGWSDPGNTTGWAEVPE